MFVLFEYKKGYQTKELYEKPIIFLQGTHTKGR